MESSTYRDLIDEKVIEWRKKLRDVEDRAQKMGADSRAKLEAQIRRLRAGIDAAAVSLRSLDEQETVANTMQTKGKILEIFNTIDTDFKDCEEKSPFML